MKSPLFVRTAVLSLSLIIISSSSTAMTMAGIGTSFPDTPSFVLEQISVLPTLLICLGSLLVLPLQRHVSGRTICLAGLVLALAGGVGPFFAGSTFFILAMRSLFGLGIGLFNPYALSLIPALFSGKNQASMMGYQNAVQGFGAATLTLAASFLLFFGWRYCYLVYLCVIPVFLMALMIPWPKSLSVSKSASYSSLKASSWILAFISFGIMLFYNVNFLRLSDILVSLSGSAMEAGTIFSCAQYLSVLSGLVFGLVFSRLHQKLQWISIILMSLGYLLTALGGTVLSCWAGVLLCGLGCGLFVPCMFEACWSPGGGKEALSSALIVSMQISGFASPFVLEALPDVFSFSPAVSSFIWAALFSLLFGLIAFLQERKENLRVEQ